MRAFSCNAFSSEVETGWPRLIKSSIQERRRGRLRPGSFSPAYRRALRCASRLVRPDSLTLMTVYANVESIASVSHFLKAGASDRTLRNFVETEFDAIS